MRLMRHAICGYGPGRDTDLPTVEELGAKARQRMGHRNGFQIAMAQRVWVAAEHGFHAAGGVSRKAGRVAPGFQIPKVPKFGLRSWRQANVICSSEEHTSEHQSLMRISYAGFC